MAMARPIARLAVGAVSVDVINFAYRYSSSKGVPIIVMATPHQINENGGYVTNLPNFSRLCSMLRVQYPTSNIILARDHLKPKNLCPDGLESLAQDISVLRGYGIQLIHLDFGDFIEMETELFKSLQFAVTWIRDGSPNTLVEISTTPDDAAEHAEILCHHLGAISAFDPTFVVIPTGSQIQDGTQVGSFARQIVNRAARLAHELGMPVKEHNADFLSQDQIALRHGMVDAFNIAPECGVAQTKLAVAMARKYKLDYKPFLTEAYRSHKWAHWISLNNQDKKLCSILAGHYVFRSEQYLELVEALEKVYPFAEQLEAQLFGIFDRYAVGNIENA